MHKNAPLTKLMLLAVRIVVSIWACAFEWYMAALFFNNMGQKMPTIFVVAFLLFVAVGNICTSFWIFQFGKCSDTNTQ